MATVVYLVPIILISLTIHEYSHGMMAHLLGDDTAKNQGRLTFNPLKHLDPIGVVFFLVMHFGWAKPVPVDPRNLKDPHRDMLFIAAAGPASNLTLALVCGFLLSLMSPWGSMEQLAPMQQYMLGLMWWGIYCNVGLVVLNMLPVFPLDGSSVLKGLVPRRVAMKLDGLDKFGGMALLSVVLLDNFAGTRILGTILGLPIQFMVEFITQEIFPVK
ncbi:MAG: site-2 protease family protein [Nitrospinota bacterium]|nr:site-2 protease family protein [Nitrospinota bacterium]